MLPVFRRWPSPFAGDSRLWGNSVAGVTCDIIRDDQAGQRSYLLLFDGSFLAYLLGALQDAAAEF